MAKKTPMPTAAELAADLIQNTYLMSHPDCPFSYHTEQGDRRVLIVAGNNASGKSLIASMAGSRAYHEHGVEPMVVSMVSRTSSGMLRAFTYGPEGIRATGEVSLSVSFKAIKAIPERLEASKTARALVILDEPDVGLAEGFSYAFGQKIGEQLNALPDTKRWSTIIISHSREMVRGMADTLDKAPTFMSAGERIGLDAWCAQKPRHSVEELDAMMERAGKQIKQVRKILDEPNEDRPKRARSAKP